MPAKPRSITSKPSPTASYRFHILNAPRADLRDLFHLLMRLPFWATVAVIVSSYLILNVLFALAYLLLGGVANAQQGSFLDALFFSVQTMGTIGYGAMYPVTRTANLLVVLESITGLVVTALATGLVFVRFTLTRPRVCFSRHAAIGFIDGAPLLQIRIGNERGNHIFDVSLRLTLIRKTVSAEGIVFYPSVEIPLLRGHATALTRAFTLQHRIDSQSPFVGSSADSLAAEEAELTLSVSGTDDTSLQPVHARYTWYAGDFAWDQRLADVLSEDSQGDMVLDLSQFHALQPAGPPQGTL